MRKADIRPAAVAGTWYPGSAAQLVASVDGHLSAAADVEARCPRALVVPHAGLMYSGPVAAFAYRTVQGCPYSAVVVVGPSHFVEFEGVAVWPQGSWATPLGAVDVAADLASAVASASSVVLEHAAAHAREHSVEMQLPFLARLLPGVPIVPLVMGRQTRSTAWALADALASSVASWERDGRAPVLIVASSDLSHYHEARTAARLDAVVAARVDALDPEGLMTALEREPGHACGGGPMVSTMRAAAALGARRARVLRYADSGDVSGDKSSVVGYLAAAIW